MQPLIERLRERLPQQQEQEQDLKESPKAPLNFGGVSQRRMDGLGGQKPGEKRGKKGGEYAGL